MSVLLVAREGKFLKGGWGIQYPEWTEDVREARQFDQYAVHDAFEFAELYEGTVCHLDVNTWEVYFGSVEV